MRVQYPIKVLFMKANMKIFWTQTYFDEVQCVFKKCPHIRSKESVMKDLALLENLIPCQVCDVAMTPTYTPKRKINAIAIMPVAIICATKAISCITKNHCIQ